MKQTKELFDEFEKKIAEKYPYLADSMFHLTDEFQQFFFENEIQLEDFKKEHLPELFKDYLNFEELSWTEASVAFQLLIDFNEFCQGENLNCQFFKDHLLNNKNVLFYQWTEGDDQLKEERIKKVLDDFDSYYDELQSGKNDKGDINKVLNFLENIHRFTKVSFEKSLEIKEQQKDLTDEEYLEAVDKAVEKELGNEMVDINLNPEDFTQLVLALPKEQTKKFFGLSLKLKELEDLPLRSKERGEAITKNIGELEELITALKKTEKVENKNDDGAISG